MPYSDYAPDDVAARGDAIYARQVRPDLTSADQGKFVVIDIETGDYEIDNDDLAATKRALARRPNAVLYGLRIGYPAAYRLGACSAGPILR